MSIDLEGEKNFECLIIGINYWLKSELLATTEVGEYGQFWLGAFTEV